MTIKRVPDYWGAKLPTAVGLSNFDSIRYEYFRDQTIALEAFKAGAYDLRPENSAKNWATSYDVPQVASGLIKREVIADTNERVMQGYVMNMRRPMFQDARVRNALSQAFDFEWSNKNLFYGYYHRIDSYFGREELAARGLPQGEELKLLEKFRDKLPPEVFTTEYNPPKTDGTGNWRDNQRTATRLLREAGWRVVDQKLVDAQGRQMTFEILLDNPQWERITLPYVENLKRLGIDARVRTVDTAQYQRRMDEFDFDMTVDLVAQSESPGNEQRDYWGSVAAKTSGSRNMAGISDPVIDALIELVISAPDRDSLVVRTRALDRALLWGHYYIPHFRLYARWIASWDRFAHPEPTAQGGVPALRLVDRSAEGRGAAPEARPGGAVAALSVDQGLDQGAVLGARGLGAAGLRLRAHQQPADALGDGELAGGDELVDQAQHRVAAVGAEIEADAALRAQLAEEEIDQLAVVERRIGRAHRVVELAQMEQRHDVEIRQAARIERVDVEEHRLVADRDARIGGDEVDVASYSPREAVTPRIWLGRGSFAFSMPRMWWAPVPKWKIALPAMLARLEPGEEVGVAGAQIDPQRPRILRDVESDCCGAGHGFSPRRSPRKTV